MKGRIHFASTAAACALAIASASMVAADDKSPTPVTPERANAGPRVASPTEAMPNQTAKRQALGEKASSAAKEATKRRVYPLAAQIVLLPEPTASTSPSSPAATFCRGGNSSRFGIVRLRYVWRPGPSDGVLWTSRTDLPPEGDLYVRDALLVVRRSAGEVSMPVQLGPIGGEVEVGRATGPLAGLLGFSKADLCPSGCTDVRLAPRKRAHANRFDQRWQRACLVARFAPTPVR